MPEVYLEIFGDNFDPKAALVGSPLLEFADIQIKGEVTGLKRDRVFEVSGLRVWVGGDDAAGLDEQIAEALRFLREDGEEIRRLCLFGGVDAARLRFGDYWPEGVVVHYTQFPNELLRACGELGLGIELCQYMMDPSNNNEIPTA